jgi:glutathionylspermidine synthase
MHEGLSCGAPLPEDAFEVLARRAALECFQWNVDDAGRTRLCDHPLFLDRALYARLCTWAVDLDAEARRAEAEILGRPALLARLGLPLSMLAALVRASSTSGCRYGRYDFHPTAAGGFAITEGNLDVASGLNEAGGVADLFARQLSGVQAPLDPSRAIAASLRASLGAGAVVGCLHLTNFVDDHQVVRFIAARLEAAGLVPVLFGPTQLQWDGTRACARVGAKRVPLDAIFRFLPAEWLPRMGLGSRWWRSLANGPTVWVNPPTTVLTQSKRFPLVWGELRCAMHTWERLLPETRSPRNVDTASDWVLKPALAHEGHRVAIRGVTAPIERNVIERDARRFPWRWAAQRRFDAATIETPHGLRYPCVGVFLVDGRPAGLYGRLAERPLVDRGAHDAVVLVREGP